MAVIIGALSAAAGRGDPEAAGERPSAHAETTKAFLSWAQRSGFDHTVEVLSFALLTWTRLHVIISLELGGHLAATGIGADVLFDLEVETIRTRAESLSAPVGSPTI